MLLCEAAGFENVLVETVGVGQSETAVRSMTDYFLLLMLAGAGDALQGIKRGIIEMVDGMAINKADGDNARARRARARRVRERAAPVPGVARRLDAARPDVLGDRRAPACPTIWQSVLEHRALLEGNGWFEARRAEQALDWMRELVAAGLGDRFGRHPVGPSARRPALEGAVRRGETTAFAAARELLALFS